MVGTLVFVLDQGSKSVILRQLSSGESVAILPGFFSLTLITNTGAAWGIMRDKGFWLTLLAVIALGFLLMIRRHFTYVGFLPRLALGLLLGGITGNLADRLMYGHVVDFLDFQVVGWHWPAFNVADSALCVGVGLYLLDSFLRKPPSPSSIPAHEG